MTGRSHFHRDWRNIHRQRIEDLSSHLNSIQVTPESNRSSNDCHSGTSRMTGQTHAGRQIHTGPGKTNVMRGQKHTGQSPTHHAPPRDPNVVWLRPDVVQFCRKYRVMYIMRGLPGSGKSTIAKQIAFCYKKNRIVVCSADDFRYDEYGNYKFDVKLLNQTHLSCQSKATEACQRGKLVIVDNTNMEIQDFEPYINVATSHGYVVLFVQMRETDTQLLAIRNIHCVPKNRIENMKSRFQRFIPKFFCWSVPQEETTKLKKFLKDALLMCSSFPMFLNFTLMLNVQPNYANLFHVFNKSKCSTNSRVSHMTTYYLSGDRSSDNRYSYSPLVTKQIGAVSKMLVIGFCLTQHTVFARVKLHPFQKESWGRDDSFTCEKNGLGQSEPSSVSSGDINRNTENALKFFKGIDPDVVQPDFGVGSTAHITIGSANGVKPVQAKHDLQEMVIAELNTRPTAQYRMDIGLLRCYRNSMWTVYLKDPIFIDSIFCSVS